MTIVPCVKLVREAVLVDLGGSCMSEWSEVQSAALRLSFDYAGIEIAADDARTRVRTKVRGKWREIVRDAEFELRAKQVLERHNVVEIDSVEHAERAPGAEVDYIVDLDGDPHAICQFSAHVLPDLLAAGWQVEIAPDYPCQLAEAEGWKARVQHEDGAEGSGWFELQLGVDVDGRTIDLLPALLDLLERDSIDIARFAASGRKCVALPIDASRVMAMSPERLMKLLEVVRELHEVYGVSAEGALRFPGLSNHAEELEGALGGELEWSGARHDMDQVRGFLSENPEDPSSAVEQPRTLQANLRPYQCIGLNWLQSLARHEVGGVLADDMGLGKTLQTIAHLVLEHEDGRSQLPSLVIAPTSLISNWSRELAKFAPNLRVVIMHGDGRHGRRHLIARADVVITSYGLAVREIEELRAQPFHLVILDEAQQIKNMQGQAHKAVASLDSQLRLCLTGTPVENNLGELHAIFDFLMPGLLGNASQFRKRFLVPIEQQGNEDRLELLRKRISRFILRRMKTEVIGELPPKTEIVHGVELTGAQRDLYESIRLAAHTKVRNVVKKRGFAASTVDILGALMKLRQVCCDPRLVSMQAARDVADSAKLDALTKMLETLLAGGHRALVFSQFTSMLELIAQALDERGIGYCMLTGSTPDRQKPVDAFESGKKDVFLISLKAGGTGLNLTSADTVIHYEPWWNPAIQNQASDRAYRMGQKRPVFVYNLVVKGSVEERMMALQQRKRDLANGLLAANSDVGSWTAEEVDDLFGPLDDRSLADQIEDGRAPSPAFGAGGGIEALFDPVDAPAHAQLAE